MGRSKIIDGRVFIYLILTVVFILIYKNEIYTIYKCNESDINEIAKLIFYSILPISILLFQLLYCIIFISSYSMKYIGYTADAIEEKIEHYRKYGSHRDEIKDLSDNQDYLFKDLSDPYHNYKGQPIRSYMLYSNIFIFIAYIWSNVNKWFEKNLTIWK